MYSDLDEMNSELIGVLWEMFRESAKTTIAKIKIIHNIVYQKKHFNIWSSFDKSKANANLFDIVIQLQTNKKLISDFGQMFFSSNLRDQKSSEKKSITEFITTNGVKVKSYSTGQSIRGEVFGEYRPDFVVLDDIETMKTVVSDAKTRQVIDFIDECLSGLGSDANFLVLANRLAETGSVAYLEEKLKGLKNWRIRNIPLIDENGLVWPEKYVMTDAEAIEVNENIKNRREWKVSVETKKKTLGETVFNREMLNRPLTDDEREFKLRWLQQEFTQSMLEGKVLNRYIAIDTANTSEHQANQLKGDPDYFGITVVDVDTDGNWYIQYAKRERLNAPEKVDKIFELWKVWSPLEIGIEEKSFESELKPYILLKGEQQNIFPVVKELKHHGKNKYERIRGALQGRFQFNKIFFRKDSVDDQEKLRLELYDFPKAKHDDLSDALAYIEQIAVRPFTQVRERYRTEIEQEFYENKNKIQRNVSNIIRGL